MKKVIKEVRDKKARGDNDVPENVLNCWEKWSQNNDTTDRQRI